MKSEKIIVITCGTFEKRTTEFIRQEITRVFNYSTDLKECSIEVSQFYDPTRRQYNADLLLQTTTQRAPVGYVKYISLFRGDLYIPILTYIFGQAQLNGEFAVASLFRLRNELYGMKENYELMLERYNKVVIHELGHTFGLKHCTNPICVMRSSTYVEDLDQKEPNFCNKCQELLNQ